MLDECGLDETTKEKLLFIIQSKLTPKAVNIPVAVHCRYYAQEYPKIDDVVMVEVNSLDETAAYVQLLEYNNIEARILLSEFSRRIHSINKPTRVGKTEPVVVIRVDEEKGNFELTDEGLLHYLACS